MVNVAVDEAMLGEVLCPAVDVFWLKGDEILVRLIKYSFYQQLCLRELQIGMKIIRLMN